MYILFLLLDILVAKFLEICIYVYSYLVEFRLPYDDTGGICDEHTRTSADNKCIALHLIINEEGALLRLYNFLGCV